MKDFKDSIDKTALSAEQRELLAYLLAEEGIELQKTQTISPRENPDEVPLSFAQQRLWFLDQLMPGTSVYNIPAAVSIQGRLNAAALEQSFNEIVQRHEALRTRFLSVDEQPVQVIAKVTKLTLSVIDLREFAESDRQIQTLQLAAEEAQQPFDLTQGPLLRAKLLRLAEEEYVLLLTMHHIVSDGWSLGVFVRELAALYEAFSTRRPSPLSKLPIQYADFALWQREWLQGEVLETQLAYWKQQLGGSLPILELPTDRPRPKVQTFTGRKRALALPKSLSEAIADLSQQEGVTPFMTLLTAFKILLYRYTRQEDILVGSPIANRNQAETQDLIGFFVNMLVLRTDLGGNPSFLQLLGRVREVVLDAYNYQDLPFEKLVETLRPERNLSHTPLFQVMFALQNAPMPALEFSGLKLSPLEVDNGTAKFDLALDLEETPNGIRGWFEYNTDLFDVATIARMTSHFQTLLESIVADPDQQIATLTMLTPTELHQLLVEWNNTQTDYPGDACIHQLFVAQVEQTPDAIAVQFKDQYLTYAELNKRANQLAHHLQGLGVRPEVVVGICVERSIEMVVGLLGILKAGGAYLPLELTNPQERLALMLSDAQVSVLLTQQRLLTEVPDLGQQVVCLDADWEAIAQNNQDNVVTEVTADNLVYINYTSGSTGKPKGVEVLHRGVIRLLFGIDYVQLDAEQKFLQMAPISFDASTFEIWGALLHGGRCVLFPEKIPTSLELGNAIQKYGITTLWLTAALFNSIIDDEPEVLSGLRQLLIGGEALSPAHVQIALETLPSTQIINGYGPTESTTFSCCYPIPRSLQRTRQSIPIGRPIGNTKVYLLDTHLQPVPVGVPGELHIAGAGLARGYLNRPDLTEEKFIPNPFRDFRLGDCHENSESCDRSQSSHPKSKIQNLDSSRLYKTGDLARYLPDGNIEFLGRLDCQVKIRGFRIELGEIETALSLHPIVQESLVMVREDIPGNKCLVAYVVPKQNQSATSQEMHRFLKDKLPDYMLPSVFMMLEALPLTANGKVNRRALSALEAVRPVLEKEYVAPRNPVEEILAEIWIQVLGIRQIGIHDNFFELGGHSLLATQLISQIRKTFQVELPLRSLFEASTIAALAVQIVDKQVEQADSEKLLDMLAELEQLSNDEAQRILSAEK